MKTILRLAALLAVNLMVGEVLFVLLFYGFGVACDVKPQADLQMGTAIFAASHVPWACVANVCLWQVFATRSPRFQGPVEWFLPGVIAGFLTAIFDIGVNF